MTKAEDRAKRDALLAEIPWVKPLDDLVPCDGVKWKLVALRDLYTWGPRNDSRPPRGIPEKALCRHDARWTFKPLHPTLNRAHERAKVLRFCTSHLIYAGLYVSTEETQRLQRWLAKTHPGLLVTDTWTDVTTS